MQVFVYHTAHTVTLCKQKTKLSLRTNKISKDRGQIALFHVIGCYVIGCFISCKRLTVSWRAPPSPQRPMLRW
jgi:hypothetical protein